MEEPDGTNATPWYAGISRYQWLVLVIASLGWIFDVFEGQIFVVSMREAIPSLVPEGTTPGTIAFYNNIALGSFLFGGAIGGIVFGMLSDRIGRKRTMSLTILFYSLFTCVSALSQEWWHLAGLRFFVAMGVGGEWAVASSLVAEVFPKRARAHVGSIFHASSVFGVYLAVAAGTFLIGNESIKLWANDPGMREHWIANFVDPASLPWRIGFALGALPALLIIWIRVSLREGESWNKARDRAASEEQQPGAILDLFRGEWLQATLVGVTLAAVGQATFWGTHIYGKNTLKSAAADRMVKEASGGGAVSQPRRKEILEQSATELKRWEMLGMFLATTGAGVGLLCFGPISQRLGRRGAFLLYHIAGLVCSLVLFLVLDGVNALLWALPVFGFFTVGMHAGYAIYFPELFPTRLRGTGVGFCFNAGRFIVPPILIATGWFQDQWGFSVSNAAATLSVLFLVGAFALAFARETQGEELPS